MKRKAIEPEPVPVTDLLLEQSFVLKPEPAALSVPELKPIAMSILERVLVGLVPPISLVLKLFLVCRSHPASWLLYPRQFHPASWLLLSCLLYPASSARIPLLVTLPLQQAIGALAMLQPSTPLDPLGSLPSLWLLCLCSHWLSLPSPQLHLVP